MVINPYLMALMPEGPYEDARPSGHPVIMKSVYDCFVRDIHMSGLLEVIL